MDKISRNQKGQVALIVLLVLTISLTIGLSLIARTVSELRATSNAEKSAQAYAAAEAGIENAIKDDISAADSSPITISANGERSSYQITAVNPQGGSSGLYEIPSTYGQNEVAQVWLFDYQSFIKNDPLSFPSPTIGNVRVFWGTPTVTEPLDKVPALEASLISADYNSGTNSFSNFKLTKFALDPISQAQRGGTDNNFDRTVSTTCGSYSFCKDLNLAVGGRPLLLRLKLLYNTKKHQIAMDSGSSVLPAQGKLIDSEGTSGNVTRKLRVYQSNPSLPGIFDFVLFNGSTTPLEK